jgi:uncharacterized protein
MDPEELLRRVAKALESIDAVRAAIVFGSQVAGRPHADSDIDIAVLLDELPPDAERKALLWSLLEALGRTLRTDRIDLVLLNGAPPKLAFHILSRGRVAFERDPVDLHRLRVRTYSRHADYQPVERLFREATKRRAQAAVRLG